MLLATIGARAPAALSDTNDFLKTFLGNDLLSTLGFIIAVTLASIANIQLSLNQAEAQTERSFVQTRSALKRSALTLIVLFGCSVGLVTSKPILANDIPTQTAFNCAALLIIYVSLEVLWDITATIFKIPAQKPNNVHKGRS